jgi:hypothetical protein
LDRGDENLTDHKSQEEKWIDASEHSLGVLPWLVLVVHETESSPTALVSAFQHYAFFITLHFHGFGFWFTNWPDQRTQIEHHED